MAGQEAKGREPRAGEGRGVERREEEGVGLECMVVERRGGVRSEGGEGRSAHHERQDIKEEGEKHSSFLVFGCRGLASTPPKYVMPLISSPMYGIPPTLDPARQVSPPYTLAFAHGMPTTPQVTSTSSAILSASFSLERSSILPRPVLLLLRGGVERERM